ncbi:MAG: hypothetical protein V4808_12320 [Pseudomonadota bacterium]
MFEDPDTSRIVAFLEGIGIPVTLSAADTDSFLPGIAIQNGGLVMDPARCFPGDLLHEAGHIAVTDPAARAEGIISDDPGDEMAAIAWSYAAALAIGIDPRVVFHDEGYRGSAATIAQNLGEGRSFGSPMLQYYGLCAEPHQAERLGLAPYPQMSRWLR